MTRESAGLKYGQAKRVVGFLYLPPEASGRHANKEDPVRNLVGGAAIGGVQPCDLAFHATPAS